MEHLEPSGHHSAFMTALADELFLAPDELTAQRHIAAAAAVARSAARRWHPIGTRWAAAITAMVTLLGTGGVALAGGLPDQFQVVVADTARALPFPLSVPYPTTSSHLFPIADVAVAERPLPAEPTESSAEHAGTEGSVESRDARSEGLTATSEPDSHGVARVERDDDHRCEQIADNHGSGGDVDASCEPGSIQDRDRDRQGNDEQRIEDRERRGDQELEGSGISDREHGEDNDESERDQQEEGHEQSSSDDSSSDSGRLDDR